MDQRRQPARVEWDSLDRLRDDGLEALLAAHFREVGRDREDVPLDVDWVRYFAMEKAGSFRAVSARRDEEILGYSGFFIMPNMHSRLTRGALNDVIYVDPVYRRLGLGGQMVDESERLLKTLLPSGTVLRIAYHTKVSHPELGHLLSARGYDHIENGHWKLVRG